MASRKVKIGAVATRIPASDDEMCSWPKEISMNGAATWSSARNATTPTLPRSAPSAPLFSANGTSTSAASAVRRNTIIGGSKTSSSATLMNR